MFCKSIISGFTKRVALAGVALVFLSSQQCSALAARHPHLPALASFDQKTVQTLVDSIETFPNASILEYGYFMRRGAPPLPQVDGYNLVVSALNSEPIGSKRWFLLQSVRAFAAFRIREVSPDEGFKAYDTIFSHAAEAKKSQATSVLRQAILSFVFSVPGRFVDMKLLSDDRTGSLLLKAWNSYTAYAPSSRTGVPEPPWTAAIQRADLGKKFLPELDKALRDAEVPKTYGLLKTAATVYQPIDLGRAIALLQQARPLLPKDAIEMRWYYSTLTDWLANSGNLTQAINTAQAGIKATDQGQGTLVKLQFLSGDYPGLQAILTSLSAPNASQAELNIAAEGLESIYAANHVQNKSAGDQAVLLLTQYLSSPRPREVEQELHARKVLTELLIQQSRFTEAEAVIMAVHYTLPLPTVSANDYYTILRQMLKELKSRGSVVEVH